LSPDSQHLNLRNAARKARDADAELHAGVREARAEGMKPEKIADATSLSVEEVVSILDAELLTGHSITTMTNRRLETIKPGAQPLREQHVYDRIRCGKIASVEVKGEEGKRSRRVLGSVAWAWCDQYVANRIGRDSGFEAA
jgi:hypothetical protein